MNVLFIFKQRTGNQDAKKNKLLFTSRLYLLNNCNTYFKLSVCRQKLLYTIYDILYTTFLLYVLRSKNVCFIRKSSNENVNEKMFCCKKSLPINMFLLLC